MTEPSRSPATAQDPVYRADLDGLRGYAVVIAVLFHYGLGVPGGFVGPEIFFVISGYLIGGIVFRAVDARRFSFARFLEFRIRRVAPAALAMIIPCLAAGYWILLPRKFERLAESALANLYFGANHLFLSQSGYFDPTSEFKPLLHTWSLSVEEQFYFLFPLLAVLLTRFAATRRVAWLTALMLVLLVVTLILTLENRDAAYFLAVSRAWEFLLGVLVVLWGVPDWSERRRNLVSALGVTVLLGCTALYNRHMAYPGAWVILPSLATAAIIRAGTGAQPRLNAWIGATPQRVIGLISYSFYIWHWPILVFTQHLVVAPLGQAGRWGAFALSLAIAAVSWRLVEQPFRARAAMPRRRLYARIGGAALVVLVASLEISSHKGFHKRWRSDPSLVAIERAFFRTDACYLDTKTPAERRDPDLCHRGDVSAPARILLWGDSHARQWSAAIDRSARDHTAGVVVVAAAACPPILDFDPPDRAGCGLANRRMMDWLTLHPEVRTVVLSARWSRYQYQKGFSERVARTLAVLLAAQRQVVLVGVSPSYHKPVPVMLARLDRLGGLQSQVRLAEANTWRDEDRRVFDRQFGASGLRVLDPWPRLCDAAGCKIRDDNGPMYFDDTHLSDAASARLSQLFDPLFAAGFEIHARE